jgi:hypothetical protein
MKFSTLAIVLLLLVISACSTSSREIVGAKRPPIDASEVLVYLQKPVKYEQIAFIKASSKNSLVFSDDGMQEVAIQRLKKEAAALGANGVLLTTSEDEVTGALGTGSGVQGRNVGIGLGLSFPITNKLIRAVAIYVAPQLTDKQSVSRDP